MRVTLISCWFQTSYGAYTSALRRALEARLGHEVSVVASNCGCGDPMEVRRQLQDRRCEYFEFPHVHYWKSTSRWKYRLRNAARHVIYHERAKRYLRRALGADVVHFQQTLNAYGSVALFNWLGLPSSAARVVTVHEFDPYQADNPETSVAYNRADRVIVHAQHMKDRLVELGVDGSRIDVVLHGVEIAALKNGQRSGLLFYGGHHLQKGKGLDVLLQALATIRGRLAEATPRLSIHGHWGETTPEVGARLAREHGVGDLVRWLNQISLDHVAEEYGKALLCVLPYTSSFAGFPAVNAMARGVPVIATRRAGLPDHLGDAALWVEENDAAGLAAAIQRLLADEPERERLARLGRERAEQHMGWDVIAERTLTSYRAALDHRAAGATASRTAG